MLCSSGEHQYVTPSDNIDVIARMRSMRAVKLICHEGLHIGQATRTEKSICPSRSWSIGEKNITLIIVSKVSRNATNIFRFWQNELM